MHTIALAMRRRSPSMDQNEFDELHSSCVTAFKRYAAQADITSSMLANCTAEPMPLRERLKIALQERVERGPAGSHALSGSWQAYKTSKSRNGSIVSYRCTADGFSAETPLGEKFQAKFDGRDYLVEDDPAHTMVSVKLLSPSTVEQTNKQDGKVVSILRLTVAPDGKTIHATYENKEDHTTTSHDMRKQPQ